MLRVALVTFESFYDHSLALDYLISFAEIRKEITGAVEFKVFVHREQDDANEITRQVVEWRPNLIGFNTYVWNIQRSVHAAREIKAALAEAVIVFGGMEATFNVVGLLKDVGEVDFVVVGEGEIPFIDLLGRLNRGEAFSKVEPGLAWRDKDGLPVSGGIGPTLTQMDDLPSPFQSSGFVRRGVRRILYESYRGCAFRCDFCLYSREYAPKRYFSLERVKADLDFIVQAGATHIRFVDATFNLDRKRAKEILRHLRSCNADVCVEVSAEFFDEEMVHLLPAAGVRHIDIGLQSTQRDALKAINREWYREDKFKQNLKLLRDEPALTLNVELIAGLPEDSPIGLRRSLDEATLTWPDHVSVYRLLGLKGTRLDKKSDELGLRFDPNPPYELIESGTFTSRDLDQVNELTFAHLVLFNLGIGRYALRYLVEVFGLQPSAVYDDFLDVAVRYGTYSFDDARRLGRHHAYGNRFDQPMPSGLELSRVCEAITRYFERSSIVSFSEANRSVALELVDFGYRLATHDPAREQASKKSCVVSSHLTLAPWCQRKSYSTAVLRELARQGHNFGELMPKDVSSIVFFYHPELGPAALAVDDATACLLDQGEVASSNGEGAIVKALREMAILVPQRSLYSGMQSEM
jgi:radical SAM superfamily enzyme YgiQ (UPF0313 family)